MSQSSHTNSDPSTLDQGDAMRRRVLGDAHVDRSRSNATDFTRPLQELVTEYCWGAVWTRPGLELKTRSLINLAMLTALGKHEELQLHVRGAIRNGVTKSEIQEVLLQTAIYCGVPAALEATRYAQATLDELGVE
ncbi:4-carboxymuconolactone decarboxylase [Lysinimonas soli]|uniref:4-carboxymuconolactone decarboxylase n=1 Tax=Lysinimonas soli TaxID=1074233 RepID=A0ABW0NPW6_9MICO